MRDISGWVESVNTDLALKLPPAYTEGQIVEIWDMICGMKERKTLYQKKRSKVHFMCPNIEASFLTALFEARIFLQFGGIYRVGK